MDYKVTGQLKSRLAVVDGVSKAGKAWSKQGFFIQESDVQYPNILYFEVFNKPELMQDINDTTIGSDITVHFNIKGTEWNGKGFNNLGAWKIDHDVDVSNGQGGYNNEVPQPPSDSSDLPF